MKNVKLWNCEIVEICKCGNMQVVKGYFAGRRDNECLAGWQLFHGFGRHVKGGLDGGTFARHGHHIVADVVEAGADAVWIARGERPAVPRRAAKRPRAVRIGKSLGKCYR